MFAVRELAFSLRARSDSRLRFVFIQYSAVVSVFWLVDFAERPRNSLRRKSVSESRVANTEQRRRDEPDRAASCSGLVGLRRYPFSTSGQESLFLKKNLLLQKVLCTGSANGNLTAS